MAIDTREKRASAFGVGRPWMRTKEPGAVDGTWRAASGNTYAGAPLSPPDTSRPPHANIAQLVSISGSFVGELHQ